MEEIKSIRISELKDFKNHPFHACLEVPDNLDIENLYLTDLPKMEKWEMVEDIREYSMNEEVDASKTVDSGIMDEQIEDVDVVESVDAQDYGEVLTEIEDEVADFGTEICETTEDTQLPEAEMTRELYEDLTDKEKAEWIGITPDNTDESIRLFTEKMKALGITYRYLSDMLDEFMRLEEVATRENRTETSSYQWNREQERKR